MSGSRNRLVVGVAFAILGVLALFSNSRQMGTETMAAQTETAAAQTSGSAPVRIVDPLPLPVSDVGRGTRFTITSPMTEEHPPEVDFSLEIPAGHIALVEHVSIRLYSCAASTISLQDFTLGAGTKKVFLIPVHVPAVNANSYLANEQTKFVAESGETISVETDNLSFSSSCGPLSMDATISGLIVPAS